MIHTSTLRPYDNPPLRTNHGSNDFRDLSPINAGDTSREPADWPGAAESPALLLNQRGGRLGVRGTHAVITGIATRAGLDDDTTAHVLRHLLRHHLVRGGTDLVIVAELLHARLDTTRIYTRPTAEDRARAVNLLPIERVGRPTHEEQRG